MTRLSRRSFLAGSSVGLAALGGAYPLSRASAALTAPVAAPPSGDLFSASPWGIFKAVMEKGRFAAALPLPEDPAPTPMLTALPDLAYAANRVRYPMVRTDYLKNGPNSDRTQRGKGTFTRVSWDDALDLIAGDIKRITRQYGPSALFCGASSRSRAGKLHDPSALLERLFLLKGGCVSRYSNHHDGAIQYVLPHVIGTSGVNDRPTAWPVIIEHSSLVVLWGADILSTSQTDDTLADHLSWPWFKALRKKGTRVIAIDPLRHTSADYFGADWIAPRPQTDVALMLGIAHTLLTEGRHDTDFLARCTTGFRLFRNYLSGSNDKQPKDAEWASAITGVPASVIRDLARAFSENRTMIMAGPCLHHQDHGEQAPWMIVTLAAMLGQIGLPGGGFGFSYHTSGAGTPCSQAPSLPGLTSTGATLIEKRSARIQRIPSCRLSDILEHPGRKIDFNGRRITYPMIRLMYWAGSNPFHHHPDRNRLIQAWQKPETIIVNDPYWTPTARFADIVLPATTQFERNDIEQGGTFSSRYLVAMHKLIDAQFESRNDFQIFSALAERLDIGPAFSEDRSEMEWIKTFYEEARLQARQRRLVMPDFETFWSRDQVLSFPFDKQSETFVPYADFRSAPTHHALSTPSGRIEITSRTIERFGYADCGPHPRWLEPTEWAGGTQATAYPLALVVGSPSVRLRSQLNNTTFREKYEINGREPVLIHPEDARERGIRNGDVVRLFNKRGQVLAAAQISDAIRPGAVRLCQGSWYDPDTPGVPGALCKHGDVNVLTLDGAYSRLGQSGCTQTAMVQIEKYADTPPDVTAFSSPEGG